MTTVALIEAFLLTLACNSPGPPAPIVEKATAPAQSKPLAAPVVATEPAAKSDPATPSKPAAPEWVRSGKRPTVSMIKKALEDDGITKLDVLGKPLALGDGRFVAAVHGTGDTASLLILSENAGAAQIEGKVEITMEGYWNEGGVGPSIATWEAKDLDADGETEAFLLMRWDTEPEPAIGGSTVGEYIVLDPDPTLTIAFQENTQISPEADTRTHLNAIVRYKDKNGDGHPDIHVRAKECADEEVGEDWKTICNTTHSDYLWDENSDSWTAPKS